MNDDKLSNIQDLLEDIKVILLLTNKESVESAKSKLLQSGSIEEKVYQLCDGENTTQDIATKMGKDTGNIRKVLSKLRQKGLVKAVEIDDKKVHERRF